MKRDYRCKANTHESLSNWKASSTLLYDEEDRETRHAARTDDGCAVHSVACGQVLSGEEGRNQNEDCRKGDEHTHRRTKLLYEMPHGIH